LCYPNSTSSRSFLISKCKVVFRKRCRPLKANDISALTGKWLALQNTLHYDSSLYTHFDSTGSHIMDVGVSRCRIVSRERCRPLKAQDFLAFTGQCLYLQTTMHYDSWFYKQFDSTGSYIMYVGISRCMILIRERCRPLRAKKVQAFTGPRPTLQTAMLYDRWLYKAVRQHRESRNSMHVGYPNVRGGIRYHFHTRTIVKTSSILCLRAQSVCGVYLRPPGMGGPVP
jgi:hypothetical protein